jgi:hypothetical protein
MRTVRQRVQMITMGTATMSVEPAICMQVVRFVCFVPALIRKGKVRADVLGVA